MLLASGLLGVGSLLLGWQLEGEGCTSLAHLLVLAVAFCCAYSAKRLRLLCLSIISFTQKGFEEGKVFLLKVQG